MEGLVVAAVLAWFVFGFLGVFIAGQKNRDPGEGFLLALLFGPFGCLIEALLPTLEPPHSVVAVVPPKITKQVPEPEWPDPARDYLGHLEPKRPFRSAPDWLIPAPKQDETEVVRRMGINEAQIGLPDDFPPLVEDR